MTGTEINAILKKRKQKVRTLAALAGCSRVALSRFLHGKTEIRLTAYLKILAALDYTIVNSREVLVPGESGCQTRRRDKGTQDTLQTGQIAQLPRNNQ